MHCTPKSFPRKKSRPESGKLLWSQNVRPSLDTAVAGITDRPAARANHPQMTTRPTTGLANPALVIAAIASPSVAPVKP